MKTATQTVQIGDSVNIALATQKKVLEEAELEVPTLAKALIAALLDRGVTTVFCVPGDYSLSLCDHIERSPIQLVCTAGEEGAAFAADAYARVHGLGVVLVTYGVGALKILNAIAGGYAERTPVLVISGAPGVEEFATYGTMLHHSMKSIDTQHRMFKEVCAETARLDQMRTATTEMGKVLDGMMQDSRPGYLEIPKDCANAVLPNPVRELVAFPVRTPFTSSHMVRPVDRKVCQKVVSWLHSSCKNPVILLGSEVQRFGLRPCLKRLITALDVPFVQTMSSKSTLAELHPGCLGVYCGAMSFPEVKKAVESADGILMIGVVKLCDLDTSIWTSDLTKDKMVAVDQEHGVCSDIVGNHPQVDLVAFLRTLDELLDTGHGFGSAPKTTFGKHGDKVFDKIVREVAAKKTMDFQPNAHAPTTVGRLVEALNSSLQHNTVVLAEVGESLFSSAMGLSMHDHDSFYSSSFWASMGYGLAAALGTYFAKPARRPMVLIGDGSFLMSSIELASLARCVATPSSQ